MFSFIAPTTDSLNHQKNEGLKWFNGTNKGYNLFKIYEDRISGDSSIIERSEGRDLWETSIWVYECGWKDPKGPQRISY